MKVIPEVKKMNKIKNVYSEILKAMKSVKNEIVFDIEELERKSQNHFYHYFKKRSKN